MPCGVWLSVNENVLSIWFSDVYEEETHSRCNELLTNYQMEKKCIPMYRTHQSFTHKAADILQNQCTNVIVNSREIMVSAMYWIHWVKQICITVISTWWNVMWNVVYCRMMDPIGCIYKLNSSGPTIDPWETSYEMSIVILKLAIETEKYLPVR